MRVLKMICKKCNNTIPDGSIFCNWCGEKQIRERKKKNEIKIPKATKLPSGNWIITLRKEGVSKSFPTEQECYIWAKAVRAEFLEVSVRAGITVKKAYENYINLKTDVLSPSTIKGYNKLLANSFPALMPLQVDTLKQEHIQRAVNAMVKKGSSPKTVRNAYGLLTSVLKMCRPGFQFNVNLPQRLKQQPRKISDEEISAIFAAAKGTDVEIPILLGLWLGLRLSEIRGLQFGDIKDHRLHVTRAIVESVGDDVVKPPKTFSGDRWISLPKYIEDLILPLYSEAKDEHGPDADSQYIITLSDHAIYMRFSRLLEKHGIQHCRFHDLRHANAAVMVKLGIESKYAQERNGWSSDKMYKDVYSYTMDDEMQHVDNVINDYFSSKFTSDFASI